MQQLFVRHIDFELLYLSTNPNKSFHALDFAY